MNEPRPKIRIANIASRQRAWFAATLIGLTLSTGAHELVYTTFLTGPNESPANASPGTGSVKVTIDFDLFTMRVEAGFANLQTGVTAAHIHAVTAEPFSGTAGAATPSFEDFPAGVTSGTYDHLIDLALDSSYDDAFRGAHGGGASGASNALFAALAQGRAYFDIHTAAFPDGEVRGFLILEPTKITSLATPDGVPTINFTTFEGLRYRVQWKEDLSDPMWMPVTDADDVEGTGNVVSIEDPDADAVTSPRRFYQVVRLP